MELLDLRPHDRDVARCRGARTLKTYRYGAELEDGVGVSSHSACGSGLPFVSGRNGAAITPTIKNRPTIVAALPKPPSATIRGPAIRGPAQEIHRGALKQNATAVPRTRVGNSSGSHTGAQAQMPP